MLAALNMGVLGTIILIAITLPSCCSSCVAPEHRRAPRNRRGTHEGPVREGGADGASVNLRLASTRAPEGCRGGRRREPGNDGRRRVTEGSSSGGDEWRGPDVVVHPGHRRYSSGRRRARKSHFA
jgi:hypothetical protein